MPSSWNNNTIDRKIMENKVNKDSRGGKRPGAGRPRMSDKKKFVNVRIYKAVYDMIPDGVNKCLVLSSYIADGIMRDNKIKSKHTTKMEKENEVEENAKRWDKASEIAKIAKEKGLSVKEIKKMVRPEFARTFGISEPDAGEIEFSDRIDHDRSFSYFKTLVELNLAGIS